MPGPAPRLHAGPAVVDGHVVRGQGVLRADTNLDNIIFMIKSESVAELSNNLHKVSQSSEKAPTGPFSFLY